MPSDRRPPVLAITQGDPAGVGPELLLRLISEVGAGYRPVLVAEGAALEATQKTLGTTLPCLPELEFVSARPTRFRLEAVEPGHVPVVDPVAQRRTVQFGHSKADDAAGAMACLDAGIEMASAGVVDALVTAPVSKESIAQNLMSEFRGHTDYLAAAAGLERYGRDYLMAFLADELQVALLSTHVSLVDAAAGLSQARVVEALECLNRHAGGRIAVAGLNPHAGENGLMGCEDDEVVAPAVESARASGIDAVGPLPADSLFARARSGEFDWVLALYHDQGLIPVKTLAFGRATNWTLGLPFLRTSVDHGTAFGIAGQGVADARPLCHVVETTCRLLAGDLPRGT